MGEGICMHQFIFCFCLYFNYLHISKIWRVASHPPIHTQCLSTTLPFWSVFCRKNYIICRSLIHTYDIIFSTKVRDGWYATVLLQTSLKVTHIIGHCWWTLWHYELWSFQRGDTKLERFSPKNQHTVFPRIVSAETIVFWIWPYLLWPLTFTS